MFKTLTGVAAAGALAIAAVATSQPAQAGSNWVGPAIGGFAAGAIVGSAIARPYPYYGGYGYAYAPGPYYGGYGGYGGCHWSRHRVHTAYGWRRVRVCR